MDHPGQPSPAILIVEASPTRKHVLQRLLSGRFPKVSVCGSPNAARERLQSETCRYDALLLSLEIVPLPGTDDLLELLRSPAHQDLAILLLTHTAETGVVEWAAHRARSAILLWQDFPDSADVLGKLLTPADTTHREAPATPGDPVRVLFVDDSRTVRASYARLLNEQGYAVEVAANAREAMAMASRQSFDIAVIDYFMPEENGDALCQHLRQNPRTSGITTAILTGTYHDQVIQDSLRAGAVECMFKNEAQVLFLARLAAMSRAVHGRKSIEAERSRLAGILGSVGDGVYGVSREGRITFINPAACRILGYAENVALVGQPASRLFHAGEGGAGAAEVQRLHEAYADGHTLRSWETVFWHQGGAVVPVECTVFPLRIEGRHEGTVVAFRDISERRVLEKELLWQANHDPLTHLYNRRYFETQLDEEVARCQRGGASALLYLDLDRFKYINDIAGHAAGDQLLVEISQLMRERLREADLLARLGGDEFAIILRNVESDQVLHAAESFREMLERYTFAYGGRQYRIYGSIGVAMISSASPSPGEVLANADIACHLAKNKGRNQTHVYRPDSDTKHAMNAELGWSTRLQQALKTDRFVLHYQPIVPLKNLDLASLSGGHGTLVARCRHALTEDGVFHCEALIRLTDSGAEPVSPNAFLPTAERFGLMPQIDLWVVQRAIEHLAALARDGTRASLSVNLSGHTLDHERLVPEVKRLLAKHAVDPRLLVFEITETIAIANIEAAQRLIGELREHGCRFALDDFGSGFSSFHHLKHLPVDYVKIDGQFVRGMLRDPADRAIVMSINDIAHSFGKRTVAEFVENHEILAALHACGVDYAQGYYISPPQAAEAVH